jgi:hypothetical protein
VCMYVSDGSACLQEHQAAMAGAGDMQLGAQHLCACSHWLSRRQNSFRRKQCERVGGRRAGCGLMVRAVPCVGDMRLRLAGAAPRPGTPRTAAAAAAGCGHVRETEEGKRKWARVTAGCKLVGDFSSEVGAAGEEVLDDEEAGETLARRLGARCAWWRE